MSAFYALNNFSKAVGVLANEKIGRRQWLCSKYVEHLCQLELTDMPDSLRKKFEEQLNKKSSENEEAN